MRATVRVGVSGWRYAPWRGVFYPPGLRQKDELAWASRRMPTIEINGSFYSLQRPSSWRAWAAAVPHDFVFAVKGGSFVTHAKKLRGCEVALANFFASGLLALGHKLGPLLWQLPPQLAFEAERLEEFFAVLPRSTAEAARLAHRHDHRLRHGAVLETAIDRPLRHAVEPRHPSYDTDAFLRVLERAGVALCVADTAGRHVALDAVTSDFVYVRLHGATRLYASGYAGRTLEAWAERIRRWARADKDVYVYFDNDIQVRAPFDAQNLSARLGLGPPVVFPRGALRARERRRSEEAR